MKVCYSSHHQSSASLPFVRWPVASRNKGPIMPKACPCHNGSMVSLIARSMGPTWGPSGAERTRWDPCWPHKLCYLGLEVTWVVDRNSKDRYCLLWKYRKFLVLQMEYSCKTMSMSWLKMSWFLALISYLPFYWLYKVNGSFPSMREDFYASTRRIRINELPL